MRSLTGDRRPVVGVVHPGAMGAAIASVLRGQGTTVLWASEGRSRESRTRAVEAGLVDVGSLEALVDLCGVVLSICPPAAAEATAQAVTGWGFDGLYIDANAVSPLTAGLIAATVASGGGTYVDGGIIGPPPEHGGAPTRLYLSGSQASRAATLFGPGPIRTEVLDGTGGSASALKMVFAAWSKCSQALLLAVRATARATGVEEALLDVWEDAMPEVAQRCERSAGITDRAWRWAGEMKEISETFNHAGLPGGFHLAAADVFARLEGFKVREPGSIDAVVTAVGTRPPAPVGHAP